MDDLRLMKLADLLGRPMFYDRAGNVIDMGRWLDLNHDYGYKTVAETVVGGVWRVHTAWLGLDHQYLAGPPLIFETMTFELAESHGFVGPSAWTGEGWAYAFHADVGDQSRYSTETQAREGHATTVAIMRQAFLPARLER
jgi:hypothetical protein